MQFYSLIIFCREIKAVFLIDIIFYIGVTIKLSYSNNERRQYNYSWKL